LLSIFQASDIASGAPPNHIVGSSRGSKTD